MRKKIKYIPGQIIGNNNIVFLEEKPSNNHNRKALFKCFCGNKWITTLNSVKNNNTSSCGCMTKARMVKHGLYQHRLYLTHQNMMQRCYNPKAINTKYYLEKGIIVEGYLHSVKNYIEYIEKLPNCYKENYTVDRINSKKNYERGNLRWASWSTQMKNREFIHS